MNVSEELREIITTMGLPSSAFEKIIKRVEMLEEIARTGKYEVNNNEIARRTR